MSPIQTPQAYYDYFYREVQYASTPSLEWANGLHAAEYWLQYHENTDKSSSMLLYKVIEHLMPYRKAGSGFHAFWLTILKTICNLPLSDQFPLWRMVFSPIYQGSIILSWNDRAQAILEQWEIIVANMHTHLITVADFFHVATAGGTSFDATPEAIMLVNTIDVWFALYIPQHSFMGYLVEQHNRTCNKT